MMQNESDIDTILKETGNEKLLLKVQYVLKSGGNDSYVHFKLKEGVQALLIVNTFPGDSGYSLIMGSYSDEDTKSIEYQIERVMSDESIEDLINKTLGNG